jgi:hypothetical protein
MQLSSLKDNWPVLVVLSVVSLLGGAAIGWGLKPEVVKIEEKIKVVEVEKQVVVEKERVRVEIVKVKDTQVVERYRKEKTQSPDGTIREIEERNIDSVVTEKQNSVEVKVVEVEKQVVVEKLVDREIKIDPVLPNWYLGATGGTELLTPVPVFGVEAKRRIAGPFWLGVYGQANTQFNRGQVGASLGVMF